MSILPPAPPPQQPPPGFPPAPPYATTVAYPPPVASAYPQAAVVVTAGTLISRTFEVWSRNLWRLLALAASFFVPGFVVAFVFVGGAIFMSRSRFSDGLEPVTILAMTVILLPVVFAYVGALTAGGLQGARGEPTSFTSSWGAAMRRLPLVIVGGLLFYLVIGLGSLLLLVPGILIGTAAAVAIPAIVAEGLGPFAAFKRSFWLTKGFRWSLFGAFLAILGLTFVGNLASSLIGLIPVFGTIAGLAIQIAIGTISAVLPAVAYHDLRVMKEGGDTTRLQRVFE